MKLSFRWFGASDPIPLAHIQQIPGMKTVVSALYDVPANALLPSDRLFELKHAIESKGLRLEVYESLPVHEDIKLGRSNRDALIGIYCENIYRLSQIGVSVICYNFMPLFDWLRTELAMALPDGSITMAYDHSQLISAPNPWEAGLPAYFPLDTPPDELRAAYLNTSPESLWEHLAYFLRGVLPAAEAAGIKMAIHPDDPPWSVLNLPRIIVNEESLSRMISVADSPANGFTFCTGSFGANPDNDLSAMIRRFGKRIYFAHCRNVKITGPKTFHEVAHQVGCGNVNLVEVMRALRDVGFSGPLRPDHGRMIWGETGLPGYGLYDRALGAMYLQGIWDTMTHVSKQTSSI